MTASRNAGEAGTTPRPFDDLFQTIYTELRQLAERHIVREATGHTLGATGLVHEVYLRLADSCRSATKSEFLRTAAQAMRHILVDHARHKKARKRDGGKRFVLGDADCTTPCDSDTLLSVDEALTKLESEDPAIAELARLRLFGGFSVDEAAEVLGISRASAFRDWAYARAWLTTLLQDPE